MVHPWVGQKRLNRNVFKTIFVRPTETRVRNHDAAWRGQGRTWLAVLKHGGTLWVHALKHSFSSGGCAFSVESGFEPIKTVPDPVRGSSLDQATRPKGGAPPPPTIMAIATALPRLLMAAAAPTMIWLPLNVAIVDNDRGDSPSSYIARALT